MEISNTVVINVITRQKGKIVSKHIKTLFMEMYGTVVISVITSQNGKELSKDI